VDLRKLEIFARVAELRSFSHAATSLHMAQPAVSIAIRKLEESLDTPLLNRGGGRVTLTSEGENLLRRALVILQEVEELKRSVGGMNDLLLGELDIACPSMLATYFLPGLLSRFLAEHPGLTAAVTQAGTTRIEELLLAGEIDIGVTSAEASPRLADLELVPLVAEEMVLCVATDHPWATRTEVAIADLHRTPMVVYASGYYIRSKLDLLCAEQAVEPDYRLQSNFLPLLVNMVRQGLGCSVGLRIMAEQEPGIVGVPLVPGGEVRMALAKLRGRTLSRANQGFLDWVSARLANAGPDDN
jgi:DNA-binding transcriptional LysR family regulator